MSLYKTYNCVYCGKLNKDRKNVAGKYCSNQCRGSHSKQLTLQRWLENPVKVKRITVRNYLLEKFGYKCNCCGLSDWMNKPITLWVDHIDGNATNNHPDNFQLVCPNCDSQQPTFGGKNYGKGRKSLGLPSYG